MASSSSSFSSLSPLRKKTVSAIIKLPLIHIKSLLPSPTLHPIIKDQIIPFLLSPEAIPPACVTIFVVVLVISHTHTQKIRKSKTFSSKAAAVLFETLSKTMPDVPVLILLKFIAQIINAFYKAAEE